MKKTLVAITTLALGAVTSSTALAADAVVPPLLTRGMDPLQTLNMTSLVSSELDFLGQFDGVKQLDAAPAGFNGKCLSSASCLSGIARNNSAGAVLAGAATNKGSNVDIMLVYFDNGRIVRTKEFSVENSPSVLADSMSGFIREIVTGESIQQVQNRDTVAFDATNSFDDEDDLFDDTDLFAGIPPVAAIDSGSSSSGGGGLDEPAELDELDLDLLGDDLPDGNDSRRAAAPEPEPVVDDYEPVLSSPEPVRAEEEFTFEFASSADSVTDAQANNDSGVVAASYAEPSRASSGYVDEYAAEPASSSSRDSRDSRSSRYDDYDDEPRTVRSSRDSRDSRSRTADSRSGSSSRFDDLDSDRTTTKAAVGPAKATITARLGRSSFQTLTFVTYGAEVSISATDNLRFVGGIEPHSTQRTIPPALLQEGQSSTVWNTIIPVNAGLQYSFGENMVRPYIGGDVLVIPGYVSEVEGVTLEGGRTATGARGRGGLDVLLSEGFALNLNISYGRWNGKDFDAVQRDLEDSGTVPQISAGTVIRF